MTDEQLIRLLAEHFLEDLAEDPAGLGCWLAQGGNDADTVILAVESLLASPSTDDQLKLAAVIEEATWMLQDVPGDNLIAKIARLTKWCQNLRASPSTGGVETTPPTCECCGRELDCLSCVKDEIEGRKFAQLTGMVMPASPLSVCDCGATTEGKWANVHDPKCASLIGTAEPTGGRQAARGGGEEAEKVSELAPLNLKSPALDPATVEACAKVAENRVSIWARDKSQSPRAPCSFSLEEECADIAFHIRALIGQPATRDAGEPVKP